MYTFRTLSAAAARGKQLSQDQLVEAFTNSDKLLKDLSRINPFVIGKVQPTAADIFNLFKVVLKKNGFNILSRVMKSGDQSYGNILATSNAFVDKYLDKLQQTGRIKRLFTALQPEAYKATNPKQYTLENMDYIDPKTRGKGQKMSDYLKSQDKTTSVISESLKDLLTGSNTNDYLPNLAGFILKYGPSSPARVKWMLDTMMRPYFTLGEKQPHDIENDLFDTPLVSLLRKHGITGMMGRKNLSLFNIVVNSLEGFLESAGLGTLDEAIKNPKVAVDALSNPTNQLQFIRNLVNTNAQYKREAKKYEGRGSTSVSLVPESALQKNDGTEDNVEDIKDVIEQNNVEEHGTNKPAGPSQEDVALAADPAYDVAFREILATIMSNYIITSLPNAAKTVITESNMTEDIKLKQMEFGIEDMVAEKYSGDVTAALQGAFSPENINKFFDPNDLLADSGRTTIATEMFTLIDEIIEDAAVAANLNPKLFTEEFKTGLSQRIAARLMTEIKPKIEASLNQNLDKIADSLVQRLAPKLTAQGNKFDKHTATLLLKEVLEYLEQFTAI